MFMHLEKLAPDIVQNYAQAVQSTVGQNLKRIREGRDIDQKDIATEMGVPQSQLSNWENDRYQSIDTRTLIRLAKAYDCTVEELLAGVDTDYDRLRLEHQQADEVSQPWAILREPGTHRADDVEGDHLDVSGFRKDDIPIVTEGDASPEPNLFWDDAGVLNSDVEDRVTRPREVTDPRAYGVRVRGDSMVTRLQPGDIAIVSPNTSVQDGDEVYAQLLSGERLLKVAHRMTGGWLLESYNRAYEPRQVKRAEIGAMHPILWIRSRRRGRRVVPDKDTR